MEHGRAVARPGARRPDHRARPRGQRRHRPSPPPPPHEPHPDRRTAITTTIEHTWGIRLPTGIRMRYVEQGPTDAPDVTVLLHGWPDSSYSFSRVTPPL